MGDAVFADNWMHGEESGSEPFVAKLNCRNILLNYKTSNKNSFGKASVYIDGEFVVELPGYCEDGWNNSNIALLLDEQTTREHVLEIRMSEGEEQKKFTIQCIGYCDGEGVNADVAQSAQGLSLSEMYAANFPIGVALPNHVLNDVSKYEEVINANFNIITCENETKPDALLDQKASKEGLPETYESPKVHVEQCQPAINYALQHDMKLRLHTLVWHSQTPKWFFTEDYTNEGKLVSIEPSYIIKQIAIQLSDGIMIDIQRGYKTPNIESSSEILEPYTQAELDEIIKNIW